MKRHIDSVLKEWKQDPFRKPLILRGARQVGKTFSVTEFGKDQFDSIIRLDFERDRSVHKIFEGDLDPERLKLEIEVHANTPISPGSTLLFLDEIQECERAVLSLRYFYEELPELHVIAAGSMLEFTLGDISFPVGRVSFRWLRPMTFSEFLEGCGQSLLARRLPTMSQFEPVSSGIHARVMAQLRVYLLTGGMPEAVDRYRETNSLIQSSAVHEDIIQSYLQSLVKYNRRADIDSLDHLVRSVPRFVGNQIKYTRLDPNRRIEKTKRSLDILAKALLLQIVQASSGSGLPLNAGASAKKIKPIFLDVGLVQHFCGIDASQILRDEDLSLVYKGALAEQFVGQELLAAGGSENARLFFWARDRKSSSAEVDFLWVWNGGIIPIEVKSGPAGKLKSLHLFLKEHPHVEKGIVLSPMVHDRQFVKNLVFMPIYTQFA